MRFLTTLALALASTPVLSHPGHDHSGYSLHLPFSLGGLELAVAMIAIGLVIAYFSSKRG
ncbi:MAG: hypothetical protein AAFX39_15725 [Pseudomonadota bacterium]